MSHYINLNNDASWSAIKTADQLTSLLASKYNCTNVLQLHDQLTELVNEEYSFFELRLETSDNGYCHWVRVTFASERKGPGMIGYWDIKAILSPLADVQYMEEGRG